MSLLNKFESIEIKATDKISQEDKLYCEQQEQFYNHAVRINKEFMVKLAELHDSTKEFKEKYSSKRGSYTYEGQTCISSTFTPDGIKRELDKIKKNLIDRICYYFSDNYNVKLDADKINKKYETSDIDYRLIIDEIILQLNGFSFSEKAVLELKDKLKKKIYSNDRIALKNNKISINSFCYIDSFDYKYGTTRLHYSCREDFETLLTIFSYFEINSITNSYEKMLENIMNRENQAMLKLHEINGTKITSLKIYKNGKVDIVFVNSQQSEIFRNEFLVMNHD